MAASQASRSPVRLGLPHSRHHRLRRWAPCEVPVLATSTSLCTGRPTQDPSILTTTDLNPVARNRALPSGIGPEPEPLEERLTQSVRAVWTSGPLVSRGFMTGVLQPWMLGSVNLCRRVPLTGSSAWSGGMLEVRCRCISASGIVPPLAALRATP